MQYLSELVLCLRGNFFKCRKLCTDRIHVECATTLIGFEWLVVDGAIHLLNNRARIALPTLVNSIAHPLNNWGLGPDC